MGVTGGSYGGYLTSWIIGHTDRFKAAVSCRSVNDLTSEMLSGDIAGPLFGKYEYGANPWDDPELYRLHSPLTYADKMDTPLLIQHSEKDLRTPITQGEELFTVLRSMHKPVRFLRVPEESHELTRSGAPFRRVENVENDPRLVQPLPRRRQARAAQDRAAMIGAAVDVGSNSVHLLVAKLTDGGLETLVDISEQLGLGDFVDDGGAIPEDSQRGLIYLLRQYRDVALAQGAEQVTFVGTEPLRRATNGRQVAELVERETGIPLQILDKEEEGKLAFVGVTRGAAGSQSMLIVDIGGGSTQAVFYDPNTGIRIEGLNVGSKRLSSEVVKHDPPTADEISRLRSRAAEEASSLPDAKPDRAVFVGGTATNIIRVRPLAAAEFDALFATLTTVPAADLAQRYILRPRRALQLAAGAALAEAILHRYGLTAAEVSDASLRDGAIIAAARDGLAR